MQFLLPLSYSDILIEFKLKLHSKLKKSNSTKFYKVIENVFKEQFILKMTLY